MFSLNRNRNADFKLYIRDSCSFPTEHESQTLDSQFPWIKTGILEFRFVSLVDYNWNEKKTLDSLLLLITIGMRILDFIFATPFYYHQNVDLIL